MEALESTGLTPQHHAVLSLLDEGTRETQGEIADTLGYDRSHLVGLLDELEEKGFVERQRDPGDRRRQLVSLTAAGKEMLGELRMIAKRVEKEFLAPLDAEQKRALHAFAARAGELSRPALFHQGERAAAYRLEMIETARSARPATRARA